MMRKWIRGGAVLLALVCGMTSCSITPEIGVSEDGFLMVGGQKTEYRVEGSKDEATEAETEAKTGTEAETEPETETETEAETERPADVITVEDGYLVVNGVKTEYRVDTEDVITVEDGYVVVNGVKTEHQVKVPHTHSFNEWVRYGSGEQNCENRLYTRICSMCASIEWKQGAKEDHKWTVVTTAPTCEAGGYDTRTCFECGKVETVNKTPISDHSYSNMYGHNDLSHWKDCVNCDQITETEEHTVDSDGICTVCNGITRATEGVVYEVSSNGRYAMVVGYTGDAKRVCIAEEYEGVPVTEIGQEAFAETMITSVEIPDSVEFIGNSAFYNCDSLTSVVIPDSVYKIRYAAFCDCSSLISVVISDMGAIEDCAFSGCSRLNSVYYDGILDSWNLIEIGDSNSYLTSATLYYYSPSTPTSSGNFWHYVDGVPTPW